MMADDSVYAEIKEKFSGSWKLDRSENFEDFLREVGVNYFVRKMAGLAKPVTDISVEDGAITIAMNAGFMKKHDTFKLGEEYDTEFQGRKVKGIATYENGILKNDNKEDPSSGDKKSYSTRQLTDDGELLLCLYIGDVICKRYFKKVVT